MKKGDFMENSKPVTNRDMSYDERLRGYELQKKTARLVCKTSEEYEAIVKQLAKIWEV